MADEQRDAPESGRPGEPEGGRDRFETVVLVLVWVLPLLLTAAVLVWIGLAWLAGALLAVEATAAGLVLLFRGRPDRPVRPRPPWVVPVVMVAVLLALLGVTLLAAELG